MSGIGYFFIISSEYLEKKGYIEFGKTLDLDFTLFMLNVGRPENELCYYVYYEAMDMSKLCKLIKELEKKFDTTGCQWAKCSVKEMLKFVSTA